MRIIGMLLLLCGPFATYAEDLVLNITMGQAAVDVAGYNEPSTQAVELQYNFIEPLGIGLTRRFFDNFEITGLSSGHLEMEAWELALVGNIPLGARFSVHPRVGYMKYDLSAYSLGSKLGEDNDYSLTLGIGGRLLLWRRVSLSVEAGRAQDVSDAEVRWLMGGVTIGF